MQKYSYLSHCISDGLKNLSYVKICSVSLLYLIIAKMNGYTEESKRNKYLMLVTTNESHKIMKKHEKLWSKIRYLTRLITNSSDDYDEKYM